MIARTEFPAYVPDLAGILIWGVETGRERDVESHQNPVSILQIEIGSQAEFIPKRRIEAYIEHLGSLPSNVFVCKSVSVGNRYKHSVYGIYIHCKLLRKRII